MRRRNSRGGRLKERRASVDARAVEDRRVLLAEDEAATATLLRKLLTGWGYSPIVVGDGRAALDILETSDPPPLALLDWMMPGLDGPSVCRAVRARGPREKGPFLFLLSARSQKADIVSGLESGADDYLTKPFDFAELKARLDRARRAPPQDADAVVGHGTVLDGRWRVDALIGKGGMGTVWRGGHATLGTPVAIKMIREDFVTHPATRARFEKEARAASAVRSPYVAEVFDYGVAPGGRPYLVMELLQGQTLAETIAARGALPAWEVAQMIGQVARGLEHVHGAGIVHRDLKPDNIFLATVSADAQIGPLAYVAKVVDFGVALDLGSAPVTDAGIAMGTVAYMSPEQMCAAAVGPTSDVWALGAVAFEALTGASPFDGGGVAATSLRVTVSPLPRASALRPELPASIDAWFASACAREPALRFQSARELSDALYVATGGRAARLTTSGTTMPPRTTSPPNAPTPGLAAAAKKKASRREKRRARIGTRQEHAYAKTPKEVVELAATAPTVAAVRSASPAAVRVDASAPHEEARSRRVAPSASRRALRPLRAIALVALGALAGGLAAAAVFTR